MHAATNTLGLVAIMIKMSDDSLDNIKNYNLYASDLLGKLEPNKPVHMIP